MKTRIVLSILVLVAVGFLHSSGVSSVDTVIKNTLAVNSVNGGNAEFIEQSFYNSPFFLALGQIILLAVILAIWWHPIKKLSSK